MISDLKAERACPSIVDRQERESLRGCSPLPGSLVVRVRGVVRVLFVCLFVGGISIVVLFHPVSLVSLRTAYQRPPSV